MKCPQPAYFKVPADTQDQDYLIKASLLEGTISEDEIAYLLNSGIKSKYLLRDLYNNHLISFHDGSLLIHDSIKEVAKNMLDPAYKYKIHKRMADFHFKTMRAQKGTKDGVLYEIIMKWGYHTELLYNSDILENKYAQILKLPNNEIDSLWAIGRFGYPFDFKTEDLTYSQSIIDQLLASELIKKNNDPQIRYMYSPKEYVLEKIDFWQECFISYLCISRHLSYHMGYIPIFEPNYSWEHQHCSCWWEHCIEYMPVPPPPIKEQIAHRKFIEEQFEKGAYDDKTPEQISFLKKVLDEEIPEIVDENRNMELEERRCPMWGHCCPDGKEQAQECEAEMD